MARRDQCRSCGSTRLTCFLDLGTSPLANRFLRPDQLDEPEPSFPLDVFLCGDCALVQLTEVVPPEVLFRDYVYVSGTSDTMLRHFAAFAQSVASRFLPPVDGRVVEIASNDGTLLGALPRGVRALGVEPATNICEIARRRGIATVNEFFSESAGSRIRAEFGAAHAVIANNVLAHVDDVNDFSRGVKALLAGGGVFVFEVSYLFDMLAQLEFDSIYHEHLSYFSITALARLFENQGMEVFDVEPQPVHGGSVRVFVQLAGGKRPVTAAPARYLAEEARRAVRDLGTYQAFATRVNALRQALTGLLRELRRNGHRLVAYGSSAKGNTLLNFMRIGAELIDYVVDKNELKQGMFTPGTHLPVHPIRRLAEDRPDYALILAWNFTDEIVAQQQDYLKAGGKFIVPIPEPRILDP